MNTLTKKRPQSQRNKSDQRGFTLVELMMATAIGSLVIIGVLKVVEQAQVEGKISSLDTQIAGFAAAAERFKKDNNNKCTGYNTTKAKNGFYVPKRVFDDRNPWGGSYNVRANTDDATFCDVYTDGMPLNLQNRLVAKYDDGYTSSAKSAEWVIVTF